jgi:hypothetical protein
MKLTGECSEPTFNNGIVKVLVTVHANKQPEYILLNLLKEHVDLKEGDTVDITITKRKRPNLIGRND